MVILNTCHIREKAAEKVYSELGRLRTLKDEKAQDGGRMLVAVAGCVAQAEGEEIVARAAGGRYGGGAAILSSPAGDDRAHGARRRPCAGNRFSGAGKIRCAAGSGRRDTGVSAFLTVQEGCDKFCTFCVVPYTRGAGTFAPAAKRSWPRRARWWRAARARSCCWARTSMPIAAQVADGEAWSLARLMRRAGARSKSLARIRYTTSHPRDMGDDLIAAHGDIEKLMPYPASAGAVGLRHACWRR